MGRCELCSGRPAWHIEGHGEIFTPCAHHVQDILSRMPRNVPFTVVGLS